MEQEPPFSGEWRRADFSWGLYLFGKCSIPARRLRGPCFPDCCDAPASLCNGIGKRAYRSASVTPSSAECEGAAKLWPPFPGWLPQYVICSPVHGLNFRRTRSAGAPTHRLSDIPQRLKPNKRHAVACDAAWSSDFSDESRVACRLGQPSRRNCLKAKIFWFPLANLHVIYMTRYLY